MPTIGEPKSALHQVRRSAASGLFRLASCILRYCIDRYERNIISPIVLRLALFAVRLLERLAWFATSSHRWRDGHKSLGRSNRP